MLLEHQRVTRAEFRAYIEQPENTEKWFELIDGVIHEVIMPKIIHAIIVQFVVRILATLCIRVT
jgi:Uma2 family endonuclease